MQLLVLGLNHKTAPVEIREKFQFSRSRIKHILRLIKFSDYFAEAVLVATCNRTELYLVVVEEEDGRRALAAAVERLSGDSFKPEYFYSLTGTDCVRHLFTVSSSLDSLIVGEGQILSQIKDAYQIARHSGNTSTLFNTIFNQAIATGKKVRTETQIAYRSVSVSSAAVDLALETLGDLSEADIMVIGAGKMSELTAQHLMDKGAPSIFVSNRSYDKAKLLADKFNGSVIRFDNFIEHAVNADIIITSTGAPHYIIQAEALQEVLLNRTKATPLILIDIAVPRDIDPEVLDLDKVILYNIDDLQNVVDDNKIVREKEAEQAREIIEDDIILLKDSLHYLSMRPMMVKLHDKFDFLRDRLFQKTMKKLPDLTEEERRIIEVMTKKMLYKFLRNPMIIMNKSAGTEKEDPYRKMIKKIFMLSMRGEDDLGNEKDYNCWD